MARQRRKKVQIQFVATSQHTDDLARAGPAQKKHIRRKRPDQRLPARFNSAYDYGGDDFRGDSGSDRGSGDGNGSEGSQTARSSGDWKQRSERAEAARRGSRVANKQRIRASAPLQPDFLQLQAATMGTMLNRRIDLALEKHCCCLLQTDEGPCASVVLQREHNRSVEYHYFGGKATISVPTVTCSACQKTWTVEACDVQCFPAQADQVTQWIDASLHEAYLWLIYKGGLSMTVFSEMLDFVHGRFSGLGTQFPDLMPTRVRDASFMEYLRTSWLAENMADLGVAILRHGPFGHCAACSGLKQCADHFGMTAAQVAAAKMKATRPAGGVTDVAGTADVASAVGTAGAMGEVGAADTAGAEGTAVVTGQGPSQGAVVAGVEAGEAAESGQGEQHAAGVRGRGLGADAGHAAEHAGTTLDTAPGPVGMVAETTAAASEGPTLLPTFDAARRQPRIHTVTADANVKLSHYRFVGPAGGGDPVYKEFLGKANDEIQALAAANKPICLPNSDTAVDDTEVMTCSSNLTCARPIAQKTGTVDIHGVLAMCCAHGFPGCGTVVNMHTPESFGYYDVTLLDVSDRCTVMNLFVDVNCRYGPHVRKTSGLRHIAPGLRCHVPWMHAKGHNEACQLQCSGLYQVAAARRSGGEQTEILWAYGKAWSRRLRFQSRANRHDSLEVLFGLVTEEKELALLELLPDMFSRAEDVLETCKKVAAEVVQRAAEVGVSEDELKEEAERQLRPARLATASSSDHDKMEYVRLNNQLKENTRIEQEGSRIATGTSLAAGALAGALDQGLKKKLVQKLSALEAKLGMPCGGWKEASPEYTEAAELLRASEVQRHRDAVEQLVSRVMMLRSEKAGRKMAISRTTKHPERAIARCKTVAGQHLAALVLLGGLHGDAYPEEAPAQQGTFDIDQVFRRVLPWQAKGAAATAKPHLAAKYRDAVAEADRCTEELKLLAWEKEQAMFHYDVVIEGLSAAMDSARSKAEAALAEARTLVSSAIARRDAIAGAVDASTSMTQDVLDELTNVQRQQVTSLLMLAKEQLCAQHILSKRLVGYKDIREKATVKWFRITE